MVIVIGSKCLAPYEQRICNARHDISILCAIHCASVTFYIELRCILPFINSYPEILIMKDTLHSHTIQHIIMVFCSDDA